VSVQVRGEALVMGAGGVYTLAGTPINGEAIYCNGLRQRQGLDYGIDGARIVSQFWTAPDVLLCDYEHL
jgi:hypothetical protein